MSPDPRFARAVRCPHADAGTTAPLRRLADAAARPHAIRQRLRCSARSASTGCFPGPLRQPSDTDVPPVFGLFVFRFALMAQIASILVPFPGHWNGVRFAGRVRALGTLRAA